MEKQKNTGLIRRVDEVGRVVIPIEIRNMFDIKEKDTMEIYIDNNFIILKKCYLDCSEDAIFAIGGPIRSVDELGRVVIPIEIRNRFDIKEKDYMEIYTQDGSIALKKYEPFCVFCGSTENLIDFKDKLICSNCKNKINKI